ncbi:hypothetical protein [Candidatus Nitrosopumilus sp. SW]|uniref:hypothetical protein n=1 Tax=Candidatus Nitrosopumilus sp. SW TaxID=2508726 RepID=UPI002105860C|nr:hypothetical protein [Candidatus Nitrosopumilus sp. SW]
MKKTIQTAFLFGVFTIILVPMYDVHGETTIANFVDPDKDQQYYLDRYYNEPTYKSWFDRNYPNISIEEAVGITNDENSMIDTILKKELIQEADATLVHQETSQPNNSEIAQMVLAIGGLGILFGAVYGIKRKVNHNTRQISINTDYIKNKIIRPVIRTNPIDILQLRLAKGEISFEEYEKISKKLTSNH